VTENQGHDLARGSGRATDLQNPSPGLSRLCHGGSNACGITERSTAQPVFFTFIFLKEYRLTTLKIAIACLAVTPDGSRDPGSN
jgi:hypothetical protein